MKFGWPIKLILSLLLLLVLVEAVLRVKYGFLSAPLYIADSEYEYIYAPNQDVVRFGNRIRTNRFSMRSDELSTSDSLTILLIGDSVINGGNLTDNDSLASTLLEARLSLALGKKVRVLNISAGSWGPDNAAAYLKKQGDFNSKLVCLVASSHDAHDNMSIGGSGVGHDPNLPDKQYSLAIEELWVRYAKPRLNGDLLTNLFPKKEAAKPAYTGIVKNGPEFNSGFSQLKKLSKEQDFQFFIYLHPEIPEVQANAYNEQGLEIIQFAARDSITLVQELSLGVKLDFYRPNDSIHYNDQGQKFLADQLFPIFLSYLKGENRL